MFCYDIVYIKGNPNSGSLLQHESINKSIIKLIDNYTFKVVDSESSNISNQNIPIAKVYIGFSRGSRYLKRLPKDSLKISIGGISSSKIYLFKNLDDNILLGDISIHSMNAHFIISKEHKSQIQKLLYDFLVRL